MKQTEMEMHMNRMAQMQAKMEDMQRQNNEMNQQLMAAGNVQNHVQKLFDDGLIKIDNMGNYVAVEDPEERSYIQSESLKHSKAKSEA